MQFKQDLCVVAVFRDEAPFLDEWLRFHVSVGVGGFILFNDRSKDNFRDVPSPWIERGLVELHERGQLTQPELYTRAKFMLRKRTKWLAFIDIDEFLFSPVEQNLPTVLKTYEEFGAVFVQWVLFGSAGHRARPDGGVLRNFKSCMSLTDADSDPGPAVFADVPRHDRPTGRSKNGKSIVRPGRVDGMATAHFPVPRWPFRIVNEDRESLGSDYTTRFHPANLLRINHYWSRSLEDLESKIARGRFRSGGNYQGKRELWLEREKHLNSSEDCTILSRIVEDI